MNKIEELIALADAEEAAAAEVKQRASAAKADAKAKRLAEIKDAALVHWAGFNHGLDEGFLRESEMVFYDDLLLKNHYREAVDFQTAVPNVVVRFGVQKTGNPRDPKQTVIGLRGYWGDEHEAEWIQLPSAPEPLGRFFKQAMAKNKVLAEVRADKAERDFARAQKNVREADDVEETLGYYDQLDPALGQRVRQWWANHLAECARAKAEDEREIAVLDATQANYWEPCVIYKLTHGPENDVAYVLDAAPNATGFWNVLGEGGEVLAMKFRGWRMVEEMLVVDPKPIAEYLPTQQVGEHLVYVRPPLAAALGDMEKQAVSPAPMRAPVDVTITPKALAKIATARFVMVNADWAINLSQVQAVRLYGNKDQVVIAFEGREVVLDGKNADDLRAWLLANVTDIDGVSNPDGDDGELPF